MNDKKDLSTANFSAESLILYKNNFISIDNESVTMPEPNGNFKKRILIITDILEQAEQELLDKMLAATSLTQDDIYHLSLDTKRNLLPSLHRWGPLQIICFGNQLDTDATTFSNRLYKINKVNDYQILNVDFLSNIVNNANAKKALWTQLKKMFEL